jgi:hypothetical protein
MRLGVTPSVLDVSRRCWSRSYYLCAFCIFAMVSVSSALPIPINILVKRGPSCAPEPLVLALLRLQQGKVLI